MKSCKQVPAGLEWGNFTRIHQRNDCKNQSCEDRIEIASGGWIMPTVSAQSPVIGII